MEKSLSVTEEQKNLEMVKIEGRLPINMNKRRRDPREG